MPTTRIRITTTFLATTSLALLLLHHEGQAFVPNIPITSSSRPHHKLVTPMPSLAAVASSRIRPQNRKNGHDRTLLFSTKTEDLVTTAVNQQKTSSSESSLTTTMPNGGDQSQGIRENTYNKQEKKSTANLAELVGLGTWMTALSSFLLINNFHGPFPANILSVPEKTWPVMHAVAGMLFGGGIILTTCIEWLVAESKNPNVLKFWFGKVPALDALIVLPALTASIISGTALSIDHYNSLSEAPFHVTAAITTLAVFAGWWALTDLTTQPAATKAVEEWTSGLAGTKHDDDDDGIPGIINFRKFSNVVSCLFVAALYGIMVIKPGM